MTCPRSLVDRAAGVGARIEALALALALGLVAAGCAGVVGEQLGGAMSPVLSAVPVASLSGADLNVDVPDDGAPVAGTSAGDFPAGWGLRVGGTGYLNTTTVDVPARVLLGGYIHFAETDTSRYELALDLTPDLENMGTNGYAVLSLHRLGFAGSSGLMFWRMGAGAIYETRGTIVESFGVLELGGGFWVELGADAGMFAGVSLQMPVGEGINAPLIVAASAGIDF